MSDKVNDVVDEFCTLLRRRSIHGSLPCARRTAEIMRALLTMQRHADAAALIDDVRSIGYRIQAAKPVELAIGNIVRRVLHIIREEAQNDALELAEQDAHAAVASSSAPPEAAATLEDPQPQGQPQGPRGGGLLSQALKVPGGIASVHRLALQSRALSLSNLLDVGLQALDAGGQAGPTTSTGGALEPGIGAPPLATIHSGSLQVDDAESQASVHKAAVGPVGQGAAQSGPSKPGRKAGANWRHKQVVIDSINDLIDELDHITTSITVQGVEHLHANEVILTLGRSDTTLAFLREAHKKREFQVVVAEGAPSYAGHTMARRLAEAGIHVTLIPDSAVFAMMARANKVIVGAHGVLANGGVIATCGMHMVALAARHFSIPFVVLVGLHKLSPLFPHQPEVVHNEFRSPAEVVPWDLLGDAFALHACTHGAKPASSQGHADADPLAGTLHVPNPAFDYIPPELVSLFITDAGGYTPSYVYRLLTEFYSREDYLLSKELLPGR